MALMKIGGAFDKPNVVIVKSYRYTEIYESTKPQDRIQAVTEANWTECHWLKQRTEICTNEMRMSETGWSQRLRQKE